MVKISDNLSDSIFDEWRIALKSKDKSKDSVSSNFDELFSTMYNAGIEREDAKYYVKKAAEVHFPSPSIIKSVFKRTPKNMSQSEFEEGWKGFITDSAERAFINLYSFQYIGKIEPIDRSVTSASQPVPQKIDPIAAFFKEAIAKDPDPRLNKIRELIFKEAQKSLGDKF